MRLSSSCFLGLLFSLCVCSFSVHAATITQDLKGNLGIMDPGTIEKCDGSYYVFGTHGGNLMSKDRVNWTSAGYNPAQKQSWWAAHGGDQWAMDATFKDGVYYCYYSVSASMNWESAIGVSTSLSLDPAKCKWTDQGIVIDKKQALDDSPQKINVIDPSTFTDDDGKWYLSFGSFQGGCKLAEINPKTGKLVNDPPHPIKVTNHAGEGSALCHFGNYYYYAISQGKCCSGAQSTYYITYGRASTVKGPYLTKNGGSMMTSTVEPLLQGSGIHNSSGGCVAVGVGGFFWDGRGNSTIDTLFMDFNGYMGTGGTALYIKPLYVDATGWISFEPTKGTVVTRPKGAVGVNRSLTLASSLKNKSSTQVRFVTGNNSRLSKTSTGALYSIAGKRVFGKNAAQIPAGIYIEKRVFDK